MTDADRAHARDVLLAGALARDVLQVARKNIRADAEDAENFPDMRGKEVLVAIQIASAVAAQDEPTFQRILSVVTRP